MSFLKDALNHLRSRKFGLHGGECQCNCQMCAGNGSNSICSSIAHTYSGVTDLWESVVCPKQEGELFHNRKCLMGECKNCGVQKLLCFPLETRKGGLSITVKVFAFVDIMDKAGNTRKRKDLLNREMQTSEFLAFLKSKLRIFITHNYLARFGNHSSLKNVFRASLMTWLFLWLTLQRTTPSKSKMKSSLCIGIHHK